MQVSHLAALTALLDTVFDRKMHRECIGCRETEVTDDMIQDFLADIHDRFNATTYNLLSNNCNNFSDEMAQFLTGSTIPVCLMLLEHSRCLLIMKACEQQAFQSNDAPCLQQVVDCFATHCSLCVLRLCCEVVWGALAAIRHWM